MRISTKNHGFTLVEMAIIIMILGLLLAPFFRYLSTQQTKQETLESEGSNEVISAALATYLAEHNRYPCPADLSLAIEDNGFGAEERNTPTEIGNCDTSNIALSSNIYYGALPIQTLKLPSSYAANKYNWKYMYAVSQSLADADSLGSGGTDVFNGVGNITVRIDIDEDGIAGEAGDDNIDLDGDGLDDNTHEATNVHFVVINPGKDGKGSTNLSGINNAFGCAITAGDRENCDFEVGGGNPDIFDDKKPQPHDNINAANHFDDFIIYQMIRKEDTFWKVDPSVSSSQVNINMRGDGNIGIGTATPQVKVHVRSGDVKIRSGGGNSGTLNVNNLNADQTVHAEDDIDGGEMSGAGEGFFYCDATSC